MAVKAGQLLHVGNQVLIDRVQTAGPGNLNIPTEKIYELGNYESVATTRDVPDLQFPLESLDVSAEIEALFVGRDFAADPAGQLYDLSKALPLDVAGQFKAGRTATDPYVVVGSVVVPYLTLESVSYRFGLRDNASQQANLRGDSIYYAGASSYIQQVAGAGTANQIVAFNNAPIPYNGDSLAGTRYALSVSLASGKRLVHGTDYTETAPGDVTYPKGAITVLAAVAVGDTIRIAYQSATPASYPQVSHAAASATRPAAIKGKDIEVRVGGNTISDRWSSIQSVNADWRVTLERDEEMGNAQVVAQDFDVPEVTGTVNIKPRDPAELIDKIAQIAGVSGTEAIGPFQTAPLTLDILLHSPDDGAVLKTLHVPDARFTLPGYSGRVQQKLTTDFGFESDAGILQVYKGARV